MLRYLAVFLALSAPAWAQGVIGCDGWQASARNIAEPWDRHSRLFANGAIRVTLLDTVEPAAGAFYLMVLAPPYDDLGGRNCGIVGEGDGSIGFAGLFFDQMDAAYDPARGLTLRAPVSRIAPSTGGFDPAILAVTIDQAAGTITPVFETP